jgi:predicted Zn-dependent protease
MQSDKMNTLDISLFNFLGLHWIAITIISLLLFIFRYILNKIEGTLQRLEIKIDKNQNDNKAQLNEIAKVMDKQFHDIKNIEAVQNMEIALIKQKLQSLEKSA